MSITGEPDGQPQKVGVAITDIVTGLYGTIGVLAAVEQRHTTGKGQHADMSLLDCATSVLANQAMNYLATKESPTRLGNAHPNIAPYQVMQTRDGYIILAVGNDAQFGSFCETIKALAIRDDPRFSSNASRVKHRDLLTEMAQNFVLTWTSHDLLQELEEAGVPAGPINTIEQAFSDPQIKHRGLEIAPENTPGVSGPWVFSDATLSLKKAAPTLSASD